MLDLRPDRVQAPYLEDAVLAGDLQGGVKAQEGVSSRTRAVGGGFQQEAVPAPGPEHPQGLDGGDEVGEKLPADGDAAVVTGARQGPGLLERRIVHMGSSFRADKTKTPALDQQISQGRAKTLAVPPCFAAQRDRALSGVPTYPRQLTYARTLSGPFAGLFPARFPAPRALCGGIAGLISASTV